MVTSHGLRGLMLLGVPSAANLPIPRPQHGQDAEGKATGNGVNDPRGIGVVVAQHLHHPAFGVPTPSRVNNPEYRADENSQNPEGRGADALDDRA